MQLRGCDVQVIYAVMGTVVRRVLRVGKPAKVPLRQIVQDLDEDGVYDRYLHTKVMTINGVNRGDRSAWVTLTGSANWSPKVLHSDDVVLRLSGRSTVRRYNIWIHRLFEDPPLDSARPKQKSSKRAIDEKSPTKQRRGQSTSRSDSRLDLPSYGPPVGTGAVEATTRALDCYAAPASSSRPQLGKAGPSPALTRNRRPARAIEGASRSTRCATS